MGLMFLMVVLLFGNIVNVIFVRLASSLSFHFIHSSQLISYLCQLCCRVWPAVKRRNGEGAPLSLYVLCAGERARQLGGEESGLRVTVQ